MGDRANVYVHPGDTPGVYLYTHWSGTELPETVRVALGSAAGRGRWTDDSYLARIIFCQMIVGTPDDDIERWKTAALAEVLEETGYGISTYAPDGRDRIVDIDTQAQRVRMPTGEWSFAEYAALPKAPSWYAASGEDEDW